MFQYLVMSYIISSMTKSNQELPIDLTSLVWWECIVWYKQTFWQTYLDRYLIVYLESLSCVMSQHLEWPSTNQLSYPLCLRDCESRCWFNGSLLLEMLLGRYEPQTKPHGYTGCKWFKTTQSYWTTLPYCRFKRILVYSYPSVYLSVCGYHRVCSLSSISIHNPDRIHSIFLHLINQLQKIIHDLI